MSFELLPCQENVATDQLMLRVCSVDRRSKLTGSSHKRGPNIFLKEFVDLKSSAKAKDACVCWLQSIASENGHQCQQHCKQIASKVVGFRDTFLFDLFE